MSIDWKSIIIYKDSIQEKELLRWIDIIGEKKYYEYYLLVRKHFKSKKVPFEELRECAIYDKKLSLVLYGIIRDIEIEMRHLVLKYISIDDFEIKYLDNIGNYLNKKTKPKQQLKLRHKTLHEFLQDIDISELGKCINQFCKVSNLFDFDNYSYALKTLDKIRNIIMHQKTLLGRDVLNKDDINAILHLIIDKQYRAKKQKEINSVAVYDNTEVRLYKVFIPESDI